MFRLAVTVGEPSGIGPDIALALAARDWPQQLVVIGDRDVLAARAQQLGLKLQFTEFSDDSAVQPPVAGELTVLHVPVAEPVVPGELNAANAGAVLEALRLACDGCLDGRFAAMVTGPVQKSIINDAGIAFSGHTEFLAERCGSELPVMMLAGSGLRVALATTHLPLRAVPDAISGELIEKLCRIIHGDLQSRFGIEDPLISVLGLNPHAGESGHLGDEEIKIIAPALERLREQGLRLAGPLPGDTAFTPAALSGVDAVLAMFHDQGLPVIKTTGFGEIVNVTLGLPIIRCSVDHGTALELAGSGRAAADSLICATELAIEIAGRR